MRLFTAIDLPADVKKMLDGLRTDIPGARWVGQEQLHLTLAFLGEVDEAVLDPLKGELARIRVPEFKLSLSGAGCFPDQRRPRVLWVGLVPHPFLNILAAKVRGALLRCGIDQEKRTFNPHITLARLKESRSPELDQFIERNKSLKSRLYTVRSFILYQSRLSQHGAEHSPLGTFPLTAAVDGPDESQRAV